jgi:hypothetical protein
LSFFKYVRTEYNDDPEVDWEECICGVKIKEVNYILYNSQEYKVGSVCIEGWSNLIDLSNAYKEFHKIGEFKEYHSCDFCNRKIKEEGNHKACEGKRDLKNIFRTWVYYTKEVKKCKKMMDLLGDVAVVFGKYRDDKIANVYNDRNYLNWLNIKYGELHICKLKGLIGSLLSDIEKYDFERQKYLLCKDDYQNYCDEILSAKLGLCRILIE